jgi:Ca2+-transporting ATPase
MTVTTLWAGGREVEVGGRGYAPEGELTVTGGGEPEDVPGLRELLTVAALANRANVRRKADGGDGWTAEGDPTEAALLVAAGKAGVERERLREERPEVAEVPFDSDRMWMATFHESPEGETVACVKGAPRHLVELSDRLVGGGGEEDLDEAGRERLLEINRELARRGLRVLALAQKVLGESEEPGEAAVESLTFLGYAGLMDPPAPGVAETVERLRRAGVRTVMITGDQSVTAEAVARDLGVLTPEEEVLDGRELARMAPEELARRVERVGTYSRVSPRDKLAIVEALQARGEIVGMLGDGVNDAPALKKADIGVAMGGRGTDVAKETAAVVLADDRFPTVAVAVEQGRVIFDNIRKFIFYLFSCNLAEVLVLFAAGVAGWPQPLLPLQILWLNLLTDVFPALALALEPPEADVMDRPPRDPDAAILSRGFVGRIGFYGLLLTASTLGVFLWGLYGWGVEVRHAVTLAFMTLALTQLAHVFNARTFGPLPWRRWLTNGWVWGALALTLGLQLAAVYQPGLSRVLDTHPLGLADWGLVAAASLLPLAVGQVGRRWVGRAHGDDR